MSIEHKFISQKLDGPDQTLIQPSNWNAPHVSTSYLSADDYNFTSTPVGNPNLTAGITNTITLTPVPLGVNGTDTNHQLYISGGTGTPEAVTITGGTAISGAATGTISFIPANSHSGAYTISSATGGVAEAAFLSGSSGTEIRLSYGVTTFHGTCTIYNGSVVRGGGPEVSIIDNLSNTHCLVFISTTQFQNNYRAGGGVRDLTIRAGSNWFSTTGSAGNAITITDASDSFIINAVNIRNHSTGILIQGGWGVHISDCVIGTIYSIGINFVISPILSYACAEMFINNISLEGSGAMASDSTGIKVQSSGGIIFTNVDIISFVYGFRVVPTGANVSYLWMNDILSDGNTSGGFNFDTTAVGAGTITSIVMVNCWGSYNGKTNTPGIFTNSPGLNLNSGVSGSIIEIFCVGCRFRENGGCGAVIFGSYVTFSSCIFTNNSQYSNNTNANLLIYNGCQNISVLGCTFGIFGSGLANHPSRAIDIGASCINISIMNNNLGTPQSPPAINDTSATSTTQIINNLGYNPIGPSGVSLGASPFTYTAGASPENIYIYGGTVSNISLGSTQIASSSPFTARLYPNQSLTITYSAAPTMVKDIQ